MSTFYVPGPSRIFIGNGSGQWLHLGFSENETEIQLIASHGDVNADFAGPSMPADVSYFGEIAVISLNLSKYNETVVNFLKARIKGGVPGGGNVANVIGSLLVAEGLTVPMAIVSTYGGLTQFSSAGMNAAYYFPQIYAPETMSFRLSTKPKIESLVLRTIPAFPSYNGAFSSYQIGLPPGVSLPDVS